MNFTHSQAKQMLSSTEMKLFQASQDPMLAGLSLPELKSHVQATRSARDKFQDLLRRQRLDSRDRTGSKGGSEGVDNVRTEQKLKALTEILHRFEAQVADVESGPPGTAQADDEPVVAVGDLMADVRTALGNKQESAAAQAASGSTAVVRSPAERASAHGNPHDATSEGARVAGHESHLNEIGSKAVQGHTSTQIRRDQAKRDAQH